MKPHWYPANTNLGLLADFILWFSRWEYTLKCFPQFSHSPRGHLEPNWREFELLLTQLPLNPVLSKSLAYFAGQPPQRQIASNRWEPIRNTGDWPLLILSLKTVRNNLFHGGKQYSGAMLEPARDKELLEHCLIAMQEMVLLVPNDVQAVFHG